MQISELAQGVAAKFEQSRIEPPRVSWRVFYL